MKKIILSAAIAFTAFISNAQDVTNDLVSKYTFDQDSIEDVIGNNNGITTNGTYNLSGHGVGKSIHFDGFDAADPQSIIRKGVIEDSIVAFNQDFTISFWFRLIDYNLDQPMNLLSSRLTYYGAEAGGIEFVIRKDPNNTLQVAGRKTSPLSLAYTIETGIIPTNQWHFVCFTQSDTIQTLYLNGTQIGQDSTSNFAQQNNIWAIGSSRNVSQSEREFKGSIDEVRFYNRALSNSEVNQLYNYTPTCIYSYGTDTRTECDSYTWIDGITYTSSNNSAIFNITGGAASGCDSLVMLDLTINSVSDITTSVNGLTITALNSNATYQWLDCDNGNTPINGAVNQTFTATEPGNYAVEINENGCVDTSACVATITAGIVQNSFESEFFVYPNPTNNTFKISTKDVDRISIYNTNGILIFQSEGREFYDISNFATGIYFLSAETNNGVYTHKIIKR